MNKNNVIPLGYKLEIVCHRWNIFINRTFMSLELLLSSVSHSFFLYRTRVHSFTHSLSFFFSVFLSPSLLLRPNKIARQQKQRRRRFYALRSPFVQFHIRQIVHRKTYMYVGSTYYVPRMHLLVHKNNDGTFLALNRRINYKRVL